MPFQEWTEVLGSERLTGALLDRLTHHVHILEMNGDTTTSDYLLLDHFYSAALAWFYSALDIEFLAHYRPTGSNPPGAR
jgi:hypothetical protein